MIESKYLRDFDAAREKHSDKFILIGDVIFVELIKPGEMVKDLGGGKRLYLESNEKVQSGAMAADRPVWGIVLHVGEGFYNESTGTDVPLRVKPGDAVLLGQVSVNWFSTADVFGTEFANIRDKYLPLEVGVARENSILGKMCGIVKYAEEKDSV